MGLYTLKLTKRKHPTEPLTASGIGIKAHYKPYIKEMRQKEGRTASIANSTLSGPIFTALVKKLPVVKGRGRGELRDFTEGVLPQ